MENIKTVSNSNETIAELCVFVYGTLKPGGRYYERYCGAYSPKAVQAAVRGRLFDFPHLGYPAITDGDSWVKGYLLIFSQPPRLCSDILRQLDRLEGYQSVRSAENDYERSQLDIFDLGYQRLQQAWVYRMSVSLVRAQGGVLVPDGDWPIS
ncbi:MAG: gamma-glutamylcyclotransferase family protein [Phormidesmis sp.]